MCRAKIAKTAKTAKEVENKFSALRDRRDLRATHSGSVAGMPDFAQAAYFDSSDRRILSAAAPRAFLKSS